MNSKFNIRRIAVAITNEDFEVLPDRSKTFVYKNDVYEKLFEFCIDNVIYDVSLNSDISIETVKDNGNDYLYLTLDFSNRNVGRRNIQCRVRLLELCCTNDVSFLYKMDQENEHEYNKDTVSNHVFSLLKEKHETDVIKYYNEIELKNNLRPILRPYQTRAVKWMIEVESTQQEINNFKEIKFIDCPNETFYINQFNLQLETYLPKVVLPKGGILADEMGLGKTIEMLSLIILRQKQNLTSSACFNSLIQVQPREEIKTYKIFCICFNNSKRKKKTIKCVECEVHQHIDCVRKFAESTDPHICPNCWSNKNELIPSSATIIVTPTTIKKQWYTEIIKHVIKPMKVLLYSGISSCWISPYELSNFDIILTDYNILKKEIYFSSDNISKCSFRNNKKYMRTASPLLKVSWFRVCLDEAQMVESTNSKASQMVKLLPAVHRWAVTGTPIQKSLEDIRGLLEFLDAFPFSEKNYWKVLINKFYEGENEPLMMVLGKIMWRSCKKAVLNELDIPEQLEKVHYVIFDDAEKLFYSNEHQICAQTFNEKVSKLVMGSAHTIAISKFDSYTLKKILEPLKKLRKDCTVPMLLKFQNNQSHIKKLLQPQELLEHLKTSNELECKNQIRLMASNYNGLAAIHMIREDYESAVTTYKNVIGLAKEFSGPLSVDSLLQIHALYNMQIAYQLNKNTENQNIKAISNQQGELEWKYINTYYKKYVEALDAWSKTSNILNQKLKGSANKNIETSFINIFEEINQHNLADLFLIRIQEDYSLLDFNGMFSEYYRSIKTVEIHIYNWLKNIFLNREQLQNEFRKYIKIMSMIKPKENLILQVSNFVKLVFDCHLKNIRVENDSEDLDEQDDEIKEICDLCKSKISLNKYECLIFDKRMDERTQLIDGTWNPSIEENILKLALSFAKSKNISLFVIEEFENSLELIELLKKEYKELSKLWIEIEYIAKVYDELEMCKMRLTVIQENFEIENKKSAKNSIYQIPIYQIDDTFQELSDQLNQSKMEFYKKLGRLKYIKHLEQNTEPDNCPICKTRPNSKYCVLDCGHIMCVLCLNEMTRYKQNALFNCVICRTKINNVYFVTGKVNDNNEILIKGEYSSKIQKIISTIIKLKIEDNKVKILIFSQWQSILKLLSAALYENSVEHRLMWSTKSIEEFKEENLNVTCMLMLLAHGSKGLNLIESTHVFLVEPCLNIADELQAINRVHRIGQTKITTVHRFIVKNTIEEKIFDTMLKLQSLNYNNLTVENLQKFICESNDNDENDN